MSRLSELLCIPCGVTAVVGGGGKTTLIDRLASELSESSRVLRMTTTHIYPPAGFVIYTQSVDALLLWQVKTEFAYRRLITVGKEADEGKLAMPLGELCELFALADYVLLEADGSRGMPLKAPNEREPALTGTEALVLAVAGMSGVGETVQTSVHRAQRYASLINKVIGDVITAEDVACVLTHENGQRKGVSCRFAVVLNQCDTSLELQAARTCAAHIDEQCALVALATNADFCEMWLNGQRTI